MFNSWLPQALIDESNPVFKFDLRRRRWPRYLDNIGRFSQGVILPVAILGGLLWILTLGTAHTNSGQIVLVLLSGVTILGTFGSTLIADLYFAAVTVSGLHRQLAPEAWELVKLTTISEEDICAAKVAGAQIRAWRLMNIEMAFRVLGAEGVLISILQSLLMMSSSMPLNSSAMLFLGLLALLGTYIVEPLWKMRAIVAMSMAAAARIRDLNFAVLAALGAIFTMRIAQMFAMGVIWFGMVVTVNTLRGEIPQMVAALCWITGMCVSLYLFYGIIRWQAQGIACRSMFRPD